MPNIFFDITGLVHHLRHSNTYTGIQRTLVMLIAETVKQIGPERVFLSFYDTRRLSYRAVSMQLIELEALVDPQKFGAVFGLSIELDSVFGPLRSYAGDPKKYRFHLARFQLNALLRNKAFFRQRNVTIADWNDHRRTKTHKTKAVVKTEFSAVAAKGDHLIILDSAWTVSRSIPQFRKANDDGILVHVMVYDLIPIVRPDLCPEDASLRLYDWLLSTLDFTNSYLAISQATKVDMEEFFAAHKASQPISVVPLAQDVIKDVEVVQAKGPLAELVNATVYPQVLESIGLKNSIRTLLETPYVLCVGTLEARKNNWRIALAWDLLRQALPAHQIPKLVFAGRSGWMNEEFNRLMENRGHLDGFATVIDSPSDAELSLLYKHCSFTILASHYEGWGLPVGESLSYGKTAVVSDNSSLPEVGGDLVLYCDSMSPQSIMDACRELIADPKQREALEARIRATQLRSWADVAEDMIQATLEPNT